MKMKTRLERITACSEAVERHVKELEELLQELKELKNDEYGTGNQEAKNSENHKGR